MSGENEPVDREENEGYSADVQLEMCSSGYNVRVSPEPVGYQTEAKKHLL